MTDSPDSCRIQVLRPDVINQIAAGEVVERPASVVKELVENALDAQARRVDVTVEQGGRQCIRIVDDGVGMTELEALLSLERHATSKLRSVDDLNSISTMGFRGEALASIASISRFSLTTRPGHLDQGFMLVVEAGSVKRQEPCGCRTGTQIEVADLFFNTPARLKFLKSTATEAAHITDAVYRLALTAPQVHFTLTQDGRQVLSLPPCGNSALERARAVLGRQGQQLFSALHQHEGLEVEACLAPPEQAVSTARSIFFTVNGRFIRDRVLMQAVAAGYGDRLEPGRFPVAVVHLAMKPTTVDVNAHPQKTEVRFDNPRLVANAVRQCITEALTNRAAREGDGSPAYRVERTDDGEGYEEHRRRILDATRRLWSTVPRGAAEAAPPYNHDDPAQPRGSLSGLRVVGQVMGAYLVCEDGDDLVLLDRCAALQRITCHELQRDVAGGRVPSQRLLIPVTLSLEHSLDAAARQGAELLTRLGFDLEDFSGGTWAVRAVPRAVRHAEPEALLETLLGALGRLDAEPRAAELDALCEGMASHASLPEGEDLEEREVLDLLAALDRVDLAAEGGRQVMVRMTRGELERMFRG